jgi:NAD(P)H-dependent flavin oxidoreductase YrpB (nitropropane dioxygenase family)
VSRLHTPFCDLLGIEYPILCAGMGGVAGPDLVAAVSNAGGLGVLGASVTPERIAEGGATRPTRSGTRPGDLRRGSVPEGTSIGTRVMWDGQVAEWPRYATGAAGPEFEGDLDYAPLWAGESVDVVNDVRPAGEIVRDLVRNAETALAAQGSE